MKVYLKNAYLINENKTATILLENDVAKVVDEIDSNDSMVLDLENRIVIRGFADVHTHLDKALITSRIANKSGTLKEAIEIMGPYKRNMTQEDIEERMRQVVDMCYSHGTRFLRTNLDIDDIIGLKSLDVFKKIRSEWDGKLVLESVAFPQEGFVSNMANFSWLEDAILSGADAIGGIPANEVDPKKHIYSLFKLAIKYDKDLDMHIDENDNPNSNTLEILADAVEKFNFKRKVIAAHCCSLASKDPSEVERVLNKVKKNNVNIVSLPSTNLYLQGRDDNKCVRRGIAPVKKICEKGINVCIASDNIRDPFNCFGNGNPLEAALIAAHGCQLGGEQDLNYLFDMITKNGIELMNEDYHINNSRFLVILDAKTPAEAIIEQRGIFATYEKGEFKKNN